MTDEWKQMEFDNKAMNDQIDRISQEDERCRRLRQIPGFGLIVSTATVAAIGNGSVRCLCARMRSLQVDAPAWLCPTTRKKWRKRVRVEHTEDTAKVPPVGFEEHTRGSDRS